MGEGRRETGSSALVTVTWTRARREAGRGSPIEAALSEQERWATSEYVSYIVNSFSLPK